MMRHLRLQLMPGTGRFRGAGAICGCDPSLLVDVNCSGMTSYPSSIGDSSGSNGIYWGSNGNLMGIYWGLWDLLGIQFSLGIYWGSNGNPVLNQPGSNGMIQSDFEHCSSGGFHKLTGAQQGMDGNEGCWDYHVSSYYGSFPYSRSEEPVSKCGIPKKCWFLMENGHSKRDQP